jgi:hypothetical protein
VQLNIRDRLALGPKGKIQVVEDEQDTISPDESGPSTIASTTPLSTLPPFSPPAPPPASKTPWDSVYLGTQWLISAQTPAGKVYRLIVAGLGVMGFIFVVNWLSQ